MNINIKLIMKCLTKLILKCRLVCEVWEEIGGVLMMVDSSWVEWDLRFGGLGSYFGWGGRRVIGAYSCDLNGLFSCIYVMFL